MKIPFIGYPPVQLTGTDPGKKTNTRVREPLFEAGDSGYSATIPEKALVKYLRAIDDMATDLLRVVDRNIDVRTGSEVSSTAVEMPSTAPAGRPTAFIFVPAPPGQTAAGGPAGELIVIDNPLSFSTAAGVTAGDDEDAVTGLVANIVRDLNNLHTDMGLDMNLRRVDAGPVVAREKFIIFAEEGNMAPAVTAVIRRDPSGMTTVLDGSDMSNPRVDAALREVYAIMATGPAKRVTSPQKILADTPPEPELDWPLALSGKPVVTDESRSAGATAVKGGEAEAIPGPIEIARRILSSLFGEAGEGTDDRAGREAIPKDNTETTGRFGGVPSEVPAQETAGQTPETSASGPQLVVRYIAAGPTPEPGAGKGAVPVTIEEVAGKVLLLAERVNAFPEMPVDEGTDGEKTLASETVLASVKTSIRTIVKESFAKAAGYPAAAPPGPYESPFGMTLDEKGLLKVDRSVFLESMSGRGDETVRFVRDFAGSFHDRIAYSFNPFAGIYSPEQTVVDVRGPRKKEDAGNDSGDKRASFEKRLNEIQMLLESSYELKESFLQTTVTVEGGPLDEAD